MINLNNKIIEMTLIGKDYGMRTITGHIKTKPTKELFVENQQS